MFQTWTTETLNLENVQNVDRAQVNFLVFYCDSVFIAPYEHENDGNQMRF